MNTYGINFEHPVWLLALLLVLPVFWLGFRYMRAIGRFRRTCAIILRGAAVAVLVLMLAGLCVVKTNRQIAIIVVMDKSLSIPQHLQDQAYDYLKKALSSRQVGDLLAVVDVAEAASISMLPSASSDIQQRNTTLMGLESKISDGIQMAMAIAPPDTAVRILLITEGNQTEGDLKEAVRMAAVNGIAVDVLPIHYKYDSEVIFRKLTAPARARSSQTVALRFILDSTGDINGKLFLNLNDRPMDLDSNSLEIGAPVELKEGTNVKTISIPVGSRGIHKFDAIFMPDQAYKDGISENNQATALVYVSGPGHILVVDTDGKSGQVLTGYLTKSGLDVRHLIASEFPDDLSVLMDADAIILVNTDCSNFTYLQQEMICRYVTEMGGGLIMTGGPNSYGAGGWIGSPVAKILPVDLEPPQKKQMPKGALVLIMHSCEMPQGNLWGERVAIAAVETLSRLDLVGILAFNWQSGGRGGPADWIYPLSEVGDKRSVISAIRQMQVGDMPDMGSHIQEAYDKLTASDAAQKHIIIISDGDPAPPTRQLLDKLKEASITCTGVAVFPHSQSDVQSLLRIAQLTGGRFYDVQDPAKLPQIFIKEAQEVKRSLIIEQNFSPQITYSLSDFLRGLNPPLPSLDGFVLTGPKGGLSQLVLTNQEGDPILANSQAGVGRCVAFTSSVDSRWASNWLTWGEAERFWEQVVRWTGRPAQSAECEILTDVQGQSINLDVELLDQQGNFLQIAGIDGQIIGPDMKPIDIELTQIGPGQFRSSVSAKNPGSYLINVRYRKGGEESQNFGQAAVTIPFAPEFQDLMDNAALLKEAVQIGNGRTLGSDPNRVNLFEQAGLDFPKTSLPLTKFFMLLWLGVFLLDIAVRRVVIDFKAIFRKAITLVRRPAKVKAEQTLEALRLKRKKIKEQLTVSDFQAASKKYEAGKEYEGEIPVSKLETPAEVERSVEQRIEAILQKEEDQSHISRLLKAKKEALEKNKDKKDNI